MAGNSKLLQQASKRHSQARKLQQSAAFQAAAQSAQSVGYAAARRTAGYRYGVSTATDSESNDYDVELPGYSTGNSLEGVVNLVGLGVPVGVPLLYYTPDGDYSRGPAAIHISPYVSGSADTI